MVVQLVQKNRLQRIGSIAAVLLGGLLVSSAPMFTLFGLTISGFMVGIIVLFIGLIYFLDVE